MQELDKIHIFQQKLMLTMIKYTIFLKLCTSMLILTHFNTTTDFPSKVSNSRYYF
jgi:hypothetical protein